MNRTLVVWCFLVDLCFVAPVSAGVFERDWKTPGDGLLTYDDVNQREWLDLTVSDISQFPFPTQAPNPFIAQVENAIAETQPGGLFDGFTLAGAADVKALALSAGVDIGSFDFSVNNAATRQLAELLGPTFSRPRENSLFAVGWLADFFSPSGISVCPCRGQADLAVNPGIPASGSAGLYFSAGDDLAAPQYHPGLMLYRIAVPEASTFCFATVACTILTSSAFRWKAKR
jgi:hypothetical protein